MSLPLPLSGVPASPTQRRTAQPPADVILIITVVTAGAAAGYVVDAELWFVTLAVAVMLAIASRLGQARSQAHEANPSELTELPPDLRQVVNGALGQLGEGDARRMLMAVVHPARSWFGMRESSFDARQDDGTRRHVGDLVAGSCAIALDLARLDAAAAPPDSTLAQRYQVARDLFAKRLDDAAAALSALYASGVERGTPASDRVAELVKDIREDASARSAAKRELDSLLGV